MDPSVPGADLERLLVLAAPIRKVVNKTIAHASKSTGKEGNT